MTAITIIDEATDMTQEMWDSSLGVPFRFSLTPEGAAALHVEDIATALSEVPLEAIWGRREDLAAEIKDLYARKTRLEAELARRVNENNPDFDQLTPGSAAVVGDDIEVSLTWKRDYGWYADRLAETRPFLTQAEYDKLIKVETTGNGTQYNVLIKRGGKLAEILQSARFFKSASPVYTPKARVQ